VESVLAQTYSPLEIIFSDDASSDRTADIIESCLADYKGPHSVTFMRHPHNLGDLARGNFVDTYRRTTGQFIVQFCGDDVMLPTMVEKMVEVWKTKHVSMVTVNAEYIDDDSRMMNKQYRDPHQTLDFSLESIARLGVNDAIFGAGQGCTREVYEYFDYPPPAHLLAGDIMFTFFACLLNGCEMISTPLMKYRIHENQLSFDNRSSQDLAQYDLRRLVVEEKMWCGHLAHAFYMREVVDQCVAKDPVRFTPVKERIEPLLLAQVILQASRLSFVRKQLYYDHDISQVLPHQDMAQSEKQTDSCELNLLTEG
jgi:glycosyltransferase involved in cell wall biosynthesis